MKSKDITEQIQVDSGVSLPSGLGGPRPSGDSVALPPISAGYSDCRQRSDTAVTISCSEISGGGAKVGVLPGISFTVIFSGYNVFKQLASGDSDGKIMHQIRWCGAGVAKAYTSIKTVRRHDDVNQGKRGALTGQR